MVWMVLIYADGARDQLLIIQGYPRVTMLWALVWALGEHSTAAGKHLSEKATERNARTPASS